MDTPERTPDDGAPRLVADRYELGPVIGAGASAQVHRAWDPVVGRAVAVKLFHATASAHDRVRQRQEMRTLARLDHPGLVMLHDGGVEAGRSFVVTDLVEGPTLAERIVDGPLPPDVVRRLGARIADALTHVHASGIVHRDVKPANVLLSHGGRPRLADFGIARALDSTAVTGTGMIVGTAAYLAPEQVRGEPVGPAADVYALGLVLLEALTGRREYQGLAVESALARLHRAPGIPADTPAGLAAVLRAMTELDPARRPSAAAVAARLAAGPTAGAVPVSAPAPAPPDTGPLTEDMQAPRRRRRTPGLIAAGVGLVVLTGAAAAILGATGSAVVPVDAGAPQAALPAVVAPVAPALDAGAVAAAAGSAASRSGGGPEQVAPHDQGPVRQVEPLREGAGTPPDTSAHPAPPDGSGGGYADRVRSWIAGPDRGRAGEIADMKADIREKALDEAGRKQDEETGEETRGRDAAH